MSSKKFKDTVLCPVCKGHDQNCTLCEGTGVVLYDEKNDDIKQFIDSDNFENLNLLDEEDDDGN